MRQLHQNRNSNLARVGKAWNSTPPPVEAARGGPTRQQLKIGLGEDSEALSLQEPRWVLNDSWMEQIRWFLTTQRVQTSSIKSPSHFGRGWNKDRCQNWEARGQPGVSRIQQGKTALAQAVRFLYIWCQMGKAEEGRLFEEEKLTWNCLKTLAKIRVLVAFSHHSQL